MTDNTPDAMAQAGFSQAPPPSGFVQAPSQFVQAPQPPQPVVQMVTSQPSAPIQVNQAPVVNSGTNVASTTVISGNSNTLNFSSIIQDNSGGISSIRCLMLLWGVGVFLVWASGAVVGLVHGVYVFPTIPPEVVTILLGVSGIKTVQRGFEK
jgi:hypothetical protein